MELYGRQKEIAMLLAEGMNNREVAGQLGMALRTVKAHVNRLFVRHGIEGGAKRVKLARLYTENVQPLPAMAPRHEKVAKLVIEGMSNKEVAAEIGTTESVVKNYMREILDITGTWSRLELATRYSSV